MQCKKRLHGGFVCLFGFFRGRWVHVEIQRRALLMSAAVPYPSWGGMLNEARGYVYMGWWMIVFPAIFTALSVLGFNLFGDGLRDLIDPLSGR